jgi:peroxiredoxin
MKMPSSILSAILVALTPMFALAAPKAGDAAPNFTLPDANGTSHSLADFKGNYVVLEWVNFGCPFVRKHYDSGNMQSLQKEFTAKGVKWLSVCSSAPGKQGNLTPEEWNKVEKEKGAAPTAVLLDPEGNVGRLYGAKNTPHMFVINPEGKIIYDGAIDSIRSPDTADIPKATNYVKTALEESMAGKPVSTASTQPYGCSVKYKD